MWDQMPWQCGYSLHGGLNAVAVRLLPCTRHNIFEKRRMRPTKLATQQLRTATANPKEDEHEHTHVGAVAL